MHVADGVSSVDLLALLERSALHKHYCCGRRVFLFLEFVSYFGFGALHCLPACLPAYYYALPEFMGFSSQCRHLSMGMGNYHSQSSNEQNNSTAGDELTSAYQRPFAGSVQAKARIKTR